MSENDSKSEDQEKILDVSKFSAAVNEEILESIDQETAAFVKYSAGIKNIKVAEKKNKLRNVFLYGKLQQKKSNEDVDLVLSQITQSVNILESASIDFPKTSSIKRISKNEDFIPFNELNKKSEIDDESTVPTSTPTCKFESQWECDTELAEIADNADALFNMINSNDISLMNTSSDKIKPSVVSKNDQENAINQCEKLPRPLDAKLSEQCATKYLKKTFSNSPVTSIYKTNNIDHKSQLESISKSKLNVDHDKNTVLNTCNFDNTKKNIHILRNNKIKECNFEELECVGDSQDLALYDFVENCDENDKNNDSSLMTFSGFTTANNRHIVISDEALVKGKEMFNSIENFDQNNLSDFKNSLKRRLSPEQEIEKYSELNYKHIDVVCKNSLEKHENKSMESLNSKYSKRIRFSDEVNNDKSSSVMNLTYCIEIENTSQNDVDLEELNEPTSPILSSQVENKLMKKHLKAFGKRKKCSNYSSNKMKPNKNVDSIDKPNTESEIDLLNREHSDLNMSHDKNFDFEKLNVDEIKSIDFVTADNKKIAISNDAIKRVKSLFDNINGEELGCNAVGPSKSKSFDRDKNKLFSADEISTSNKYGGFKTANNREIIISDVAIQKTRNIFDDVRAYEDTLIPKNLKKKEHPCVDKCNLYINNDEVCSVSSNTKNSVLKNPSSIKRTIIEDWNENNSISIKENINNNRNESKIISTHLPDDFHGGFKTASNKNVIVSEKALKNAKKIFDNFEPDKVIDAHDLISKHVAKTPLDSIAVFNDNSKCNFGGFKTASNKNVTVSDQALKNAKKIFDNLELENIDTNDLISKNVAKTSHDSLTVVNDNSKCNFGGFKTASNKNVLVSEQALKNAKKIFDNIEPDNITDTQDSISKHVAKIPHDSLTMFNDNSECNFGGFKTASNKNVTVSDQALRNAKKIFDNLESEKVTDAHDSISTHVAKTPHDSVAVFNDNSKCNFGGFKTASNKNVTVSDQELKNAKKIFDNLELENTDTNNSISKHVVKTPRDSVTVFNDNLKCNFGGFKTASNKNVTVSDQALKNAKKIFDNLELENTDTNNSISKHVVKTPRDSVTVFNDNLKCNFGGFKTASNKNVTVSDQALKNAKKIFDNLELEKITDTHDSMSKHVNNNHKKDKMEFDIPTQSGNKEIKVSHSSENHLEDLRQNEEKGEIKLNKELIEPVSIMSCKDALACFKVGSTEGQSSEKYLIKPNNIFCADNIEISDILPLKTLAMNEISKQKDKIFCQMIFHEDEASSNVIHNIKESKLNNDSKSNTCKHLPVSEGICNSNINDINIEIFKEEICETAKAFLADENSSPRIEIDDTHSPNEPMVEDKDMPLSPILQFKGGFKKKRKVFNVPFKKNKDSNSVNNSIHEIKKRKLSMDENNEYLKIRVKSQTEKNIKTNKNITLKELKCLNDKYYNERFKPDIDILNINPENFEKFVFKELRCDIRLNSNNESITIPDIVEIFMNYEDLDKKLIPDGWVINHIKWIVWKLASYERTFINLTIDQPVLNVTNVLKQLKYRYDRELFKTERPILRKIFEKDDVPSKRMILCVSRIISVSNDEAANENEKSSSTVKRYELELTDGWYSILTIVDSIISGAISKGKIVVGTKLVIHGAELLNCSQGIAPLEDTNSVRLKIWANNCRRCSRWLKLGLWKKNYGPLPLKLASYVPGGGPILHLQIVPILVYPALYLNKSANGSLEMRSEKQQQICSAKIESELQYEIERLYGVVEKEFSNDKRLKIKKSFINLSVKSDDSPEEISIKLENAADPQEFMNSLTESQSKAVQQFILDQNVLTRQKIDQRVKDLMSERGLEKKQAVRVLKARIVSPGNDKLTSALLTIWGPDDATLDIIKEGACLNVKNLTPTGIRMGELQLSVGRRSIFTEVPFHKYSSNYTNIDDLKRVCTPFQYMYSTKFAPMFNEVDTVGIVIDIEPEILNTSDKLNNQNQIQTVFIANEHMHFVALIFWGGIKKYGFDKVIQKEQCIACSNLQFKSRNLFKRIRQLHISEVSSITRCPRKPHLEKSLQNLEAKFKSIGNKNFMSDCSKKLKCLLSAYLDKSNTKTMILNTNSIDQKYEYSDNSNLLKENKKYIDDMSDIDFDETFSEISDTKNMDSPILYNEKSTRSILSTSSTKVNISSILNENKLLINDSSSKTEIRMNKLKMYGDAPNLSPLVLKNSDRLKKSFQVPVANHSFNDDTCKSLNLTSNETVETEISIEGKSEEKNKNRIYE